MHPSSTSFGWGKDGNVSSAGWQVTLCDPMWHMSSRSGVATLRTAIHLLLTYFYIVHVVCNVFSPLLARAASAISSCLAAVNSKVVLLFWYLPARVVLKKEVGWHIGQPRTNNSDVVWVKLAGPKNHRPTLCTWLTRPRCSLISNKCSQKNCSVSIGDESRTAKNH